MKRKLLTIILVVTMATALTACGGKKKTETTAPAESAKTETAAPAEDTKTTSPVEETTEKDVDTAAETDEMVSDENFKILQDNYALMVNCYEEVSELYSSDEIAANADIEKAMDMAADVINQMGEIKQDEITEEDAETLNSAIEDILNALSDIVDGMETTGDAGGAGEMVTDETFAALQENYEILAETYNVVAEAYNSDAVEANTEIEDALNQAYEIIDKMGTITQDSITEEDAEELVNLMIAIIEVLDVVVDAM